MIKKIVMATMVLTALVACKSKSAFEYSENFVKKEKSLEGAITKVEADVAGYFAKEQYDSIGKAGERMEKLIDEKLSEIKSEPAPDVKEADQFKKAGIRYFEYIKSMYTCYKEYGYAKTPEERDAKLDKLKELAGKRTEAASDIQASQRKYAEANGFKLESK